MTIREKLKTILKKCVTKLSIYFQEYDHPHKLLKKTGGYFYKLVQETGPVMSQQLYRIAEEVRNIPLTTGQS